MKNSDAHNPDPRGTDYRNRADASSGASVLRSRKFVGFAIAAALAAGLVAWLAFGIFGIHTAFIDETVSEANPFAVETTDSPAATAVVDDPPDSLASVDDTAPAAEESAVTDQAETSTAAETEADTTAADTTEAEPAAAPAEAAAPEIMQLATGTLVDHDHSGEGTAVVLSDGSQRFLRFEDDFDIDNGPDLNVYLVRGVDAEGPASEFDDDFIDLGDLKGNKGAQNYEIPADVDLDEYNTVVIWCVRFGVAFNAADLV